MRTVNLTTLELGLLYADFILCYEISFGYDI